MRLVGACPCYEAGRISIGCYRFLVLDFTDILLQLFCDHGWPLFDKVDAIFWSAVLDFYRLGRSSKHKKIVITGSDLRLQSVREQMFYTK